MEHMDVDTFMREGLAPSKYKVVVNSKSQSKKSRRPKKKSQGQKQREKLQLAQPKSKKRSSKSGTKESATVGDDSDKPGSATATTVKQHKAVIGSLAANDPEFYKFLQEEDKALLNFNDSSEDEGDVHQLPESLVEQQEKPKHKRLRDSDSESDSDFDSDSADEQEKTTTKTVKAGRVQNVTSGMVEKWSRQLEKGARIEVIESLVKAMQGAVAEATGDSSDTPLSLKVEGVTVFNAVVRTCLRNLPTAFTSLLKYNPKKSSPAKCKRWSELKPLIRSYLTALLVLLKNLAAADVINAVLKHITQLTNFISCMPKQTRLYVKAMIGVWCTGEETSRVLAFLSLLRLVRLKQEDLLEKTLKAMYMAYIRNCKFTSPTLLPMISFMQHSLVEVFSLDRLLGYQYTFVYVRQLAIHLRNAMASKKKESYQAVYNWQFIHGCAFFSRLVSSLYSDENIKQLLFPLVQIIVGVIRLIPTEKFYPLRFQCIRMLNMMSLKTGTYIPALTHLLEVIEITDFQKKMSRVNTKPVDFSCILKLSKSQTQDRAFKDGVMDQLYELILDNLVCFSHTSGFPELVPPAIHQMKQFVKSCKVANFTKLFKQLIAKMEEASEFLKEKRKSAGLDLSDAESVAEWEMKVKREGTPLISYYKQYRVLRDREVQMEIAGKEQMEFRDKTPIIPTGQRKATESERQEFANIFEEASGDDSDDSDEERFKPKHERKKKGKPKGDENSDDDVSSLNSEEYAMLDKDVSDSEEEGDQSDMDSETADDVISDLDILEGEDIVEDLELSDMES